MEYNIWYLRYKKTLKKRLQMYMIELWRKDGFPGRGLYYFKDKETLYIKTCRQRRDEEDGGYATDQRIDAVSVLFKPVCCILRD